MSTLNVTNIAGPSNTGTAATLSSINGGPISGARNRIINGDMRIDQRNGGAAHTIPNGGAARTYTVDRWGVYSFNAAITGQRVQGATAGQYRYQLSGAAGCATIEFAQRIEQLNSADLAGTTVTLSADFANSLLTTVNWYAFYANSADNFSARTSIASGTFTVNSTVARYSTNISVPAAATTGIEIIFTVGAQTSGTWTIGNVQLEAGTVATPFERRSYGQELSLCQRYLPAYKATAADEAICYAQTPNASTYRAIFPFQVATRVKPTGVSVSAAGDFYVNGSINATCTSATFNSSTTSVGAIAFGGAGMAAGFAGVLFSLNANAQILFTGCEL